MADWICENCGCKFQRDKSGARPIRFCDVYCYQAWQKGRRNAGQFQKGQQPWNCGVKGIHNSPATEWKKGQRSRNWLPLGSMTIRDDKNGTPRAFVKVAEPNSWQLRATLVWEAANGPLPSGYVVHHHDHNSLNDEPQNLRALSRAEHIAEHRADLLRGKDRANPEQRPLFGDVA